MFVNDPRITELSFPPNRNENESTAGDRFLRCGEPRLTVDRLSWTRDIEIDSFRSFRDLVSRIKPIVETSFSF